MPPFATEVGPRCRRFWSKRPTIGSTNGSWGRLHQKASSFIEIKKGSRRSAGSPLPVTNGKWLLGASAHHKGATSSDRSHDGYDESNHAQ